MKSIMTLLRLNVRISTGSLGLIVFGGLGACSTKPSSQFDLKCDAGPGAPEMVFSIDLDDKALYLHNPNGPGRPDDGKVISVFSVSADTIIASRGEGSVVIDRNTADLTSRYIFRPDDKELVWHCQRKPFSNIPDTAI